MTALLIMLLIIVIPFFSIWLGWGITVIDQKNKKKKKNNYDLF